MSSISGPPRQALERLLKIAARDTGQSRRVANFLLAWWNPQECGRFDFLDMWGCDTAIVDDMLQVLAWIGHHQNYPDTLGYSKQFEAIVRAWRPALFEPKKGRG